jgi:hypothetical protein
MDNGPPANVNGRPVIYTHNHYNIPTNHNIHINHIHIIHENIKMLALGPEAQPINKSIKINWSWNKTSSGGSHAFTGPSPFYFLELRFISNTVTDSKKLFSFHVEQKYIFP